MARPSVAPVVWQPPPAPARARQPRSATPMPPLTEVPVPGVGPEDVAVDISGRVVTGVDDGRILRWGRKGMSEVANTGGRPLGIERLGHTELLVCDARRGLLQVDPDSGSVEVLCDEVGGAPLRFCNNAAVAADGTVYFSDSSRRFTIDHWKADLIEHSGTGRLLRRDPGGEVEVLMDGLQFANGVALAPDESFVAVAETGAYQLQRLWLTGESAGTVEVLIGNLPGFPDNISTGSDGLIWITIGSRRDAILDRLHPLPPVLRRMAWAMPERLQPAPVPTVWVMAVDADGRVVHDFQEPPAAPPVFSLVTGVREVDGRVYLGSLTSHAFAFFDLPQGAS